MTGRQCCSGFYSLWFRPRLRPPPGAYPPRRHGGHSTSTHTFGKSRARTDARARQSAGGCPPPGQESRTPNQTDRSLTPRCAPCAIKLKAFARRQAAGCGERWKLPAWSPLRRSNSAQRASAKQRESSTARARSLPRTERERRTRPNDDDDGRWPLSRPPQCDGCGVAIQYCHIRMGGCHLDRFAKKRILGVPKPHVIPASCSDLE